MRRKSFKDREAEFCYPEPNTGCWIWTGRLDKDGYGSMRDHCRGGKPRKAHRVFYEHYKGSIPVGLEIDHLCRVRCCVNPRHLEAVTSAVNNERGFSPYAINKRRTHCASGHPFSGPNLIIIQGKRRCVTCKAKWNRANNRKVKKRKSAAYKEWVAKYGKPLSKLAKLTMDQANELRALRTEGWTLDALAEKYGLGTFAVRAIALGRRYKNPPNHQ